MNVLTRYFRFFERMELNDKRSLDFFNKEYVWSLKNYSSATYHSLTLTEIIESDKEYLLRIIHNFLTLTF